MTRLCDRVVIVTGSSTGIGEGIARRAVEEGARVVVHGLDAAETAATAESLGGVACPGDLADPETATRLVAAARDAFGRLDAVVNNAGISPRGSLEETTPELFDRIMAVNARAPMLLAQAALPAMRAAGAGRIVNIGSINAHQGGGRLLAYSMSKGALMTMTRNLANAHAHEGIRVNQLNIGWTLTPNEHALLVSEGLPEDWPESVARPRLPFGRMFTPADIAAAVCFLLSDEAELLNGAVIDYDQLNRIGRF